MCTYLIFWQSLLYHISNGFVLVIILKQIQGQASQNTESAKEAARAERVNMFSKRAAHAAGLRHKKPTSSVDAEMTGGSTLSSQALPKQETSTASSKGITFKQGMLFFLKRAILLWLSYVLYTCIDL